MVHSPRNLLDTFYEYGDAGELEAELLEELERKRSEAAYRELERDELRSRVTSERLRRRALEAAQATRERGP